MASSVEKWIAENISGLSFCDIGGIGLNSLNERISVAVKSGASDATMIDYRRFGFPEWAVFDKKMQEGGITGVKKIDNANLEDRNFPKLVGQYDFVHSTGIIYHAPAPMLMLANLAKISRRFLVTNTIIVPSRIENELGVLDYPGSQVVFLPGLSESERAIFDKYYQEKFGWPAGRFSLFAPRICDPKAVMPWLQTRADSEMHFWGERNELSYSPYWWLFTATAFRAAVELFGFKIHDEWSFKGHTLTLFCERIS